VQENALVIKQFDWLDVEYSPIISYIALQEDFLENKPVIFSD